MKRLRIAALLAAVCATGALAQQPGQRGALLYENHCGACHATQMHWRDKRVASDWASLRTQVKRWQDTALLSWSDEEIDEVARYLNKRFYRFDEPATRVSRAGG
jgi:mono/diheme cytochrome c family protein